MAGNSAEPLAGTIESERELIETYLAPLASGVPGAFGLSDDCAYLSLAGSDIAITADPIIAGVHFFADERPDDIAWKALAVNISDLSAKGARPLAYIMTLAFPSAPERSWMQEFAAGLAAAQTEFGCHLAGGDTDKSGGPLSIGITMIGTTAAMRFVRRSGALAGDRLFVTGTIGDAYCGLQLKRQPTVFDPHIQSGDASFLIGRYLRPNPRVAMRDILPDFATASLDISDGLLKDAGRLARASGLGVVISLPEVPLSPPSRIIVENFPERLTDLLSGGDDYEILFAVPEDEMDALRAASAALPVQITEIGWFEEGNGVQLRDLAGNTVEVEATGWDHF